MCSVHRIFRALVCNGYIRMHFGRLPVGSREKLIFHFLFGIADEGVGVIVEDLSGHPVCEHGPTILFEHRKANGGQKYFACSAYRDRRDCAAHIPFELWNDRTPDHSQPSENVKLTTATASDRRQLLHEVRNG